jgi:glycine/sarcosine N-methyltransferase
VTFADVSPPDGRVEPAADYDRFVDWRKRLSREAPFFRALFEAHGVRRVLDAGCGTGKHAAMWASEGLDVVGVDPSPSMLAQARLNAASAEDAIREAGGSLEFVEGRFGDLAELGLGPVDALTCTGNGLPHVEGRSGLHAAIRDFAAVLRPGGLCVLHLLNHDRLLAGRVRSIPPVVRDADDGTWVFLRVMDYPDESIAFDFITMHRPCSMDEDARAWEASSRRSVHTAIPSAVLRDELEDAGFGEIRFFGDHESKPFDAAEDESVIAVALRR